MYIPRIIRIFCLTSAASLALSCGSDDGVTAPDTKPPELLSVVPTDGAKGVSVSTGITANFSEAMKIASFTGNSFSISPPVAGAFASNGNSVTFDPDNDLDYVTDYTVSITTGVQDLAGNALDTAFSWTFTTEPNTNTGKTWAEYTMGSNTMPMNGLATNGSRVVAVGDSGRIYYSSSYLIDNSTGWTRYAASIDTNKNINDVVWSGASFIAVGDRGAAYVSTDGTFWTISVSGTTEDLNAVAFYDGEFVAVGDSMTIITSSNQGSSWDLLPRNTLINDTLPDLLDIVAVSNPKNLMIIGKYLTDSDSGTTVLHGSFVSIPAFTNDSLLGLAHAGQIMRGIAHSPEINRYVVVGNEPGGGGRSKWTPDGSTWQTTSFANEPVNDIAWSRNLFAAVCNNGEVWTSPDASPNPGWTDRSSAVTTNSNLRAIIWSGRQLIVVGENGDVLVSPDPGGPTP